MKTESKKFLITGLGNIGDEYVNTRHNVGFLILDALAQKCKTTFKSEKFGYIAKTTVKGKILYLLKPDTYVNLSGNAIKYWANTEKIPMENMLVVLDDINLPTGMLRIKPKGGDGGHNGLIHIIMTLATENIPRLRIGIGNEFTKGNQIKYVLGKWTKEEEKILNKKIPVAVEAILTFVNEGIQNAMNKYNNDKNEQEQL